MQTLSPPPASHRIPDRFHEPRRRARANNAVAQAADDLTKKIAAGVSRRRFLKGAGAAAAATGMSVGATTAIFQLPAGAEGTACDPCGPSDYCSYGVGECDPNFPRDCAPTPSSGAGFRRSYNGATCTTADVSNYWLECHCPNPGASCPGFPGFTFTCNGANQGQVRCSDCCMATFHPTGPCLFGGGNCVYQGQTYYKCVCKVPFAGC